MVEVKKSQIAVNTIFYILMVIFMIGIIVFGMQKLFFTKDLISEQERIEIQKDLTEALEYCYEPLNSKNLKYVEFRNKLFNGFCVLGDDFGSSKHKNIEGFKELYEAGDNVILLKTAFGINQTGGFEIQEFVIVDAFKVEVNIPETFCNFDYNNTGVAKLEIECK